MASPSEQWPELSFRTGAALTNAGIASWEDLSKKSREELLRFRLFGEKGLAEVETQLCSRGLSLAPSRPDAKKRSCRLASPQEINRRAQVLVGKALEPLTESLEAEAMKDGEGPRVLVPDDFDLLPDAD